MDRKHILVLLSFVVAGQATPLYDEYPDESVFSFNFGGYGGFFSCYAPDEIEHGTYHPHFFEYTTGSTITYKCNHGYSMNGLSSKRCTQGGWQGPTPSCKHLNPCATMYCGSGTKCTLQSNGGAYCKPTNPCYPNPCSDVNSYCQSNPSGVGYTCPCKNGYTKQNNGHTCQALHPCALKYCGPGTKCTVIGGQGICTRIDPCNPNPCHDVHSFCKPKASGSGYTCPCQVGYSSNGHKCIKLNPCDLKYCQSGTRCVVLDNGQGHCKPIDPCLPNPCADVNSRCMPNGAKYTCNCNDGYTHNGKKCVLLNPCIAALCPEGTKCVNSNGEANCISLCGPKEDYNSCASSCQPTCDDHKSNKPCILSCNSRPCECKDGYVRKSLSDPNCVPKSECPVDVCHKHHCHVHATCKPMDHESYNCVCNEGYEGPGRECKKIVCHKHHCHEHADCVPNDHESYNCVCKAGYVGPGKTCRRIWPCETNPCHPQAKCTNEGYTKYRCNCNTGYNGDGKMCEKIICSAPPLFENGMYMPVDENYIFDDVITITCSIGYSLGPQNVIKKKCGPDGIFVPDIKIVCNDIDECRRSPCPEHSTCFNNPGSFQCKCNPGYITGDSGSCIMSTCIVPRPLINGIILPIDVDTINWINVITYKCKPGYEIIGAETRTCMAGGNYNPSGQTLCKDIDECKNNPCGENAICMNMPGSYQCKCMSGYIGNPKTGCMAPRCNVPRPLEHGMILPPMVSSVLAGTTIEYKCMLGYRIDGDDIRECVGMNQWNPSGITICVDIDECENGPCGENAVCYNMPGTYQCKCRSGYTGDPKVRCIVPRCDVPRPLGHGMILPSMVQSVLAGTSIEYKCMPGYRIDGDVMRECMGMNQWQPSGSTVCNDIDECAEGNPCSQYSTCMNTPGSFKCKCNMGYVGDGTICRGVCRPLELNPHTTLSSSQKPFYTEGEEIEFICANGYMLVGPKTSMCNMREWTKKAPVCIGKCLPQSLTGGVMVSSPKPGYDLNDRVDYSCPADHSMHGATYSTCVSHNTWSNTPPECRPMQCPRPVLSPMVSVVPDQTSYLLSAVVVFQCPAGYKVMGSSAAKCQWDKTWSASSPYCQMKGCSKPKNIPYSIPLGGVKEMYEVGYQYTIKCHHGYTMLGNMKCGADGNWVGQLICKAGSCAGKCNSYLASSSSKCRCGNNCRYNCCPDYNTICKGYGAGSFFPTFP